MFKTVFVNFDTLSSIMKNWFISIKQLRSIIGYELRQKYNMKHIYNEGEKPFYMWKVNIVIVCFIYNTEKGLMNNKAFLY